MLIRGTVHGRDGAPIDGAVILFAEAPVDVPDVAALSGVDGTFVLAAPAPGRYRLLVRADGHDDDELVVDVSGDVDVVATLGPVDGPTP